MDPPKDHPLYASLEQCNKIAVMIMDCDFPAIKKVSDHSDDLLVKCLSNIALSMQGLMTSDAEKCKKASKIMKKLLSQVNEKRDRSWRSYYSHNYYDSLSEEEVHFELLHCEMQLFCALLCILAEPSFSGFVSAAFHIKYAHSGYCKCKKILEHRSHWVADISKQAFEAGTLFGLSIFELMISFFPGRFIRLIELFGFCGNREEALGNMRRAVICGDSTPRMPFIALLFTAYYSFLEYYFGLGHDFSSELDKIIDIVNSGFEGSPISNLLNGLNESSRGNLTTGNEYFQKALQNEKAFFIRDICIHQMFWNQVFLCDWFKATEAMKALRSSLLSKAAFCFQEGVCLKMLLEESKNNNKIHLDEDHTYQEVTRIIKQVRGLKKNFGGGRAFHEQIVLLKSDQFKDNTDGLFLTPFEVAYIFHYFRLFVKKPDVAENILKTIDGQERNLNQSDELFKEKSALALFLKAVVHRQMQEYDECIKMFTEVLEMDINEKFTYLHANAHYELGFLYFEVYEEYNLATAHLKKAKATPNQVSKQMIDHRVAIVMDLIKQNKNM